jgi:nicotinate-nucleotide pyrophosphorylase (carboxylating)
VNYPRQVDLIASKKLTEASGMITSKNLIEYAETGVDFISMGSLSYDTKNIDMSLKAII